MRLGLVAADDRLTGGPLSGSCWLIMAERLRIDAHQASVESAYFLTK
jgi:hypothetical protein